MRVGEFVGVRVGGRGAMVVLGWQLRRTDLDDCVGWGRVGGGQQLMAASCALTWGKQEKGGCAACCLVGLWLRGCYRLTSLPAAQPPPALLRTLPSLPLSLCLSLGALCFENVACSHHLNR